MFETAGGIFFDALRQAAERHLEPGHPCLAILGTAARAGNPAATVAAQEALAALDPAMLNAVMADAHKLLRDNPRQVLHAWGPIGTRH